MRLATGPEGGVYYWLRAQVFLGHGTTRERHSVHHVTWNQILGIQLHSLNSRNNRTIYIGGDISRILIMKDVDDDIIPDGIDEEHFLMLDCETLECGTTTLSAIGSSELRRRYLWSEVSIGHSRREGRPIGRHDINAMRPDKPLYSGNARGLQWANQPRSTLEILQRYPSR